MAIAMHRSSPAWRLGSDELKDYLVHRFGIQQATLLYSYHQLLLLHGPAEMQRRLGPERYVNVVVLMRQAGIDV